MKTKFLLLMMLCLRIQPICSQNEQANVNLPTNANGVLIYCFDQFKNGKVFFTNQKEGVAAMLNYNYLSQEMQFVENGKVLNLVKSPNIARVEIEDMVFIPFEGSYISILKEGRISLLYYKKIWEDKDRTGAYGAPTNTSATQNISQLITHGGATTASLSYFIPNNTKTWIEEKLYLSHGKKILPLSKKNFLRCFPDKKETLETEISRLKTDFGKREDVLHLLELVDR